MLYIYPNVLVTAIFSHSYIHSLTHSLTYRQDQEAKHKQLEDIQKEIARLRNQQISQQEQRKQQEKIKAMEFELGTLLGREI